MPIPTTAESDRTTRFGDIQDLTAFDSISSCQMNPTTLRGGYCGRRSFLFRNRKLPPVPA
jgi:hypothetical protein